jgi:glycosyltransferase involved in cell wall biosynthesis
VWRGEWGGVHSLAVVNDGVTAALERRGLRVERALRAQNAHDIAAPGVAQQWPPRFEPPSAGPFVLYQPWEYGRVPARWVADIRELVDEVWVPSEATRRAYVDSGVSPDLVHVVPNGVDLDRFTPQGSRWPLPAAGTTFLFVGGTIPRKGVDVLLEAYRRAFGAGDDVLLVVKSFGAAGVYRGQTADGLLEELAADPSAPPLLVLADDVAAGELPALYRAADVLVQPYRGEGFCLPALEALACGVPVAVTAGGPTDEFVTDGCGWRIPSVAVTFPADAIASPHELAGDGVLLEPDVDALAHVLADAARPERRAAKARAARPQAERFAWERAAAAASARLDELRELTPVRHLPPADVAGRRRTLLACLADWDDRATWAPALGAYTAAFSPNDDVTLVLPATDPERAEALVVAELAERGIDPRSIPDVAIAATAGLGATSLELTADAVIACGPRRPTRARRVLECDAESVASAIAI